MKIIKPSFEILNISPANPLELLELAGRVCYKSEDKILPDTALPFVKKILEGHHESVIEHASMTIKFVCDRGVTHELVRHRLCAFSQESTRYCNYNKDKFGNEITVIEPCFWVDDTYVEMLMALIERAITVTMKKYQTSEVASLLTSAQTILSKSNKDVCDELMINRSTLNRWLTFKVFPSPCSCMLICDWVKTNASDLLEKTSYERQYNVWKEACQRAEVSYFALLQMGASPQQARTVLPNSLKTEIVMTADLREWRHVFKLRTSKAAHPQMRELMIPTLEEVKQRIPLIFYDMVV